MSSRRGLTTDTVIDGALAIVDADGAQALTLSGLARSLGVATPSLYNHVDGLDPLRRAAAMHVMRELATVLGEAAMGRSGTDALHAVAGAVRRYALANPGRYALTTRTFPEDPEFSAAAMEPVEPVLAILRGFDLDGDGAIHAARGLRSALHGFVTLELNGGFGLDVDVDASFRWLVEGLVQMLSPGRTT